MIIRLTLILAMSLSIVYSAIDTSKSTFYLYSYFEDGSAGEAAGTFLLISTDGVSWEYCNNKKPIITPKVGSGKLMRDPCLFYASDKTFHLVWTTGWTGKDIGYASSKDLLTWSEQRPLNVMSNYPNTAMCWAPEIFYNDLKQEFMIYWSSDPDGTNVNGDVKQTFYVTTKDFINFSTAKTLFSQNYSEIDATLLKTGDSAYTIFFKDERINDNRGRIIYYVTSNTPEGPWSSVSASMTQRGVEGPTAIKIDTEYRVYFDPYSHSNKSYRYVKSTNLKDWSAGSPINISFRHGTILSIPKKIALWLLYSIPIEITTIKNDSKKNDYRSICIFNSSKHLNKTNVNLFDMQGKLINKKIQFKSNVSNQPSGNYLIVLPRSKDADNKILYR